MTRLWVLLSNPSPPSFGDGPEHRRGPDLWVFVIHSSERPTFSNHTLHFTNLELTCLNALTSYLLKYCIMIPLHISIFFVRQSSPNPDPRLLPFSGYT